jgi:hypothetical protein
LVLLWATMRLKLLMQILHCSCFCCILREPWLKIFWKCFGNLLSSNVSNERSYFWSSWSS